jgi:predicted dehydrogenase
MDQQMSSRPTRWAVLGTAGIAAKSFLPAVRSAGQVAAVVGSRDPARAAVWGRDNQAHRAATYQQAIEADDVDAVYIAVPNDQHVALAAQAAAAGRAVLCEKALGLDAGEVETLLRQAGETLLWEAFVFPFHPQTALLTELCRPDGPIGEVREIITEFHYRLFDTRDIRWRRDLCAAAGPAAVRHRTGRRGRAGRAGRVRRRRGDRRGGVVPGRSAADLLGRHAPGVSSTGTRIIGTDGDMRVSNPYHLTEDDAVELWRSGRYVRSWPADPVRAFEYAVRHVGDVVAGVTSPAHLAATDALGNARALDLVRAAARLG